MFIPFCSSNDTNLVSNNQPYGNNWVVKSVTTSYFFFFFLIPITKHRRLSDWAVLITAWQHPSGVLSCFSCVQLCGPMDCSLPGSSVHGNLQARVLEWVAMPSSRGSSWPRDWTHVCYISYIGRWILYH